jgi:hypothetical protein
MLRGSFRSGDAKRVGLALLVSLGAMMPGKTEHIYSVLRHVFFALTTFGLAFAYFFRERLLTRIGGRLLLAWNILLVFVALRSGWTSGLQVFLLAIPTTFTIINAFSDIDRDFDWKVVFHAWFSTILVALAWNRFDTGPLAVFLQRTGPIVTRPPLEMIVSGAAYLYIVTNAWFVLALVPIPLSRGQKWSERMDEIYRHMRLLAQGYVWEKDDPLRSLAVLVGLPLLLIAFHIWGRTDDRVVISLAIAMMPLVGGGMPVEQPAPSETPGRKRKRRRR